MNFVSLFKGRGKLIKLLKVKSETERKLGQVRYMNIAYKIHKSYLDIN